MEPVTLNSDSYQEEDFTRKGFFGLQKPILSFSQCIFQINLFIGCSLKTVSFRGCKVQSLGVEESKIENLHFFECTVYDFRLLECHVNRLSFENCILINCRIDLEESPISSLEIKNCRYNMCDFIPANGDNGNIEISNDSPEFLAYLRS